MKLVCKKTWNSEAINIMLTFLTAICIAMFWVKPRFKQLCESFSHNTDCMSVYK